MYQILVVDDDESIAAVVTAALERNGYIRSESDDIPILIYRKNLAEN